MSVTHVCIVGIVWRHLPGYWHHAIVTSCLAVSSVIALFYANSNSVASAVVWK